jgi:hypothetical protein
VSVTIRADGGVARLLGDRNAKGRVTVHLGALQHNMLCLARPGEATRPPNGRPGFVPWGARSRTYAPVAGRGFPTYMREGPSRG